MRPDFASCPCSVIRRGMNAPSAAELANIPPVVSKKRIGRGRNLKERGVFRDEAYDTIVPDYMREIVAEVTHLARKSPDISQRSGVSVRVSVANFENILSSALRRAILRREVVDVRHRQRLELLAVERQAPVAEEARVVREEPVQAARRRPGGKRRQPEGGRGTARSG